MRRIRILFRILLTLIFTGFIIGFFLLSYVAPKVVIKTSNSRFQAYRFIERGDISTLETDYDTFTVKTFDSLLLKGYLIYTTDTAQKGTIVMVHGIRAGKEIYINRAERMAKEGYNIVLFDLRAHGQSEGDYCTFGYHEEQDISSILDSIDQNPRLIGEYGIWGQSLGGAVALQALESDDRLNFGIIESTFGDFRTIVYDYAEYSMGIKNKVLINYVIYRAAKIGEFNPDEVIPKNSAKNIHQPVLVAHGGVDNRIDNSYGKEIYNNLASAHKELIIIDSAKHTNLWEKGGEEYFNSVLEFISSSTVPPANQ